jgi:hypothetical protein
MSDTVDKTAAGATRGFFGSISFILLLLGLEMLTDKSGVQLGLGFFLVIFGAICAYAAFFWESAKKVLSSEAQEAIGRFAQSHVTWFGMIFLILQSIILSRFVEDRRWPFSYPADPAIYTENNQLKAAAQASQQDAARWRFSFGLRYGAKAANGSLLDCKFSLVLSRGAPAGSPAWNIWVALQPMLELARWVNLPTSIRASDFPFQGITVISGDNKDASNCASFLGKALGEAFPQSRISVRTNQVSPVLTECKSECVELNIGD